MRKRVLDKTAKWKRGIGLCGITASALLLGLALFSTAQGAKPGGGGGGGPQASITLKNGDAALCFHNNTQWDLTKTPDEETVTSPGTITWTVKATRGPTSDDFLDVDGFVTVANTGSAPATIGNIVVNLQRYRYISKKKGSKWVSASVDVADATSGDAATTAKIVAAGSQEDPATNATFNAPATYTVSGSAGTFTENSASGSLEFTDADSNTIWAITPQKTIAAGTSVNLLFQARFNNTVLGIPEGESVRAEVIVTFGNAGARGGSGAVGTNIDINGNGGLDTDEAYVRSVPVRLTRTVPELEWCNDSVTLTDLGLATEGTVETSNFNDGGIGSPGIVINSTTEKTITVDVSGGADGDRVCNTATLVGESSVVSVIIDVDPITFEPTFYDFPCCNAVDLSVESCVSINVPQPPSDFCTATNNKYGNTAADQIDAELLETEFGNWFPSGLTIGVEDGLGPKHDATWTDVEKLQDWIGGGGASGMLTADTFNATSTSGGLLAKETATLSINIARNGLGFGLLKYDAAGDSLDDKTLIEILAVANTALGEGTLPSGYSYNDLRGLLSNLNASFVNCDISHWAEDHLK